MKLNAILPLVIGGVVALLAWNYFSASPEAKPRYLIAGTDIPENHAIDRTWLAAREWDKPGSLSTELISDTQADVLVTRFTRARIEKGKPITESSLWPAGVNSGMMTKLRENPDMRAHTIRVDDISGGGGFIRPGSLVDVIASASVPRGGAYAAPEKLTKAILQKVEVLAVNQEALGATVERAPGAKQAAGAVPSLPRSVTLLVSAQQVEEMETVVANSGRLSLSLVSANATPRNSTGRTLRQVFDIQGELRADAAPAAAVVPPPAESPAPAANDRHVVEVFRGQKPSADSFVLEDGRWVRQREDGSTEEASAVAAAPSTPAGMPRE